MRVPLTPALAQDDRQGVLPFGKARKPAGTKTEDGIGHAA